ncbi:YdcF family protein [Deinococcus aquaticus]|uniref:YdcF family protein n=1 Tax=Deinococcus aquaticus TaxID=328692 RepID=UPI00360A7EE5
MRSRGATLTLLPLAVAALLVAGFVLTPNLRVPNAATPHATLVVLGAAQYAGKPSPAFKRRLDHALTLYRAGGVQRVVVTGGRRAGDPYTEGGVGTTYLARQGVPAGDLIAEERSRTTVQNLQNARAALPPTPPDPRHRRGPRPRALALARAIGLNANVSASPLSTRVSRSYLLREKVALVAYALIGIRL